MLLSQCAYLTNVKTAANGHQFCAYYSCHELLTLLIASDGYTSALCWRHFSSHINFSCRPLVF